MSHESPQEPNLEEIFERYLTPEDLALIEELKDKVGLHFDVVYSAWQERLRAADPTPERYAGIIQRIKIGLKEGMVRYKLGYYTEALSVLRTTYDIEFEQLTDPEASEQRQLDNDIFNMGKAARQKTDELNEVIDQHINP